VDKPKVLLHICCAPDSTAVFERLKEQYHVIGYFHNSNIQPEAEYERRLADAKKVAKLMNFSLIIPPYLPEEWLAYVRGFEAEPEKGKRCILCYQYNLNATAAKAKALGIPDFTTTLSISPHKVTKAIMEAGEAAGEKYQVNFLAMDFKKKDGFKRSLELSQQLDLYRQNYCGCKFSLRKND